MALGEVRPIQEERLGLSTVKWRSKMEISKVSRKQADRSGQKCVLEQNGNHIGTAWIAAQKERCCSLCVIITL